jgi:hypothetical protein
MPGATRNLHVSYRGRARSAVVVALATLPVGILGALANDRNCDHLLGDVTVAEPGTPRAGFCDAVHWHSHWIAAIAAPVILAAVVGASASQRHRSWVQACGWLVGVGIAVAVAVYLAGLPAAATI